MGRGWRFLLPLSPNQANWSHCSLPDSTKAGHEIRLAPITDHPHTRNTSSPAELCVPVSAQRRILSNVRRLRVVIFGLYVGFAACLLNALFTLIPRWTSQ